MRCGPAPEYHKTDLEEDGGEKYYDDELNFKCKSGYSTDQDPKGPKAFTLRCTADGDFSVKGSAGNTPVPQCRPVSAGMSPHVEHGNAKAMGGPTFNPRNRPSIERSQKSSTCVILISRIHLPGKTDRPRRQTEIGSPPN